MSAFFDGSRTTPGTEKCQCDKDEKLCEWPCWQRLGLTPEPCCAGCPPLPDPQREAARTDPRGLGDGLGS